MGTALTGHAADLMGMFGYWENALATEVTALQTSAGNCATWGATFEAKAVLDKMIADTQANLAAVRAELRALQDANAAQQA